MPAQPGLLDSYWIDIHLCEPVSREREAELVRKARNGDGVALHDLITANLRFVVTVANEFRGSGCPMNELISDGNAGLAEAARRFDETRGFKFITYAVWWIRQAMLKALAEQSRAARPPMNQVNDLQKVEKRAARLTQQLGRAPTPEEIAVSADISLERARSAIELSQSDLSLDAPLSGEDGDDTMQALLAMDGPGLDESFDQDALFRALHECINHLDEREQLILRAYYGLQQAQPMTLEQIGEVLSLTRERIRQLRDRALERVRVEYGELLLELSSN